MTVKPVTIYDNTFQQKLEEIDLSHNKLTTIHHETFSQLNSLIILNLKHNNIRLKYGLFPLMLKRLDLSYNQLKDFTLRQLLNSQLLEELKLNGNYMDDAKVEHIFPEAIFQLMHVYRLELSDCFNCMRLADVLIHFKRINRNIIVQFEREQTNSSNIFGISCVDTSANDIWWNIIIVLHAPLEFRECDNFSSLFHTPQFTVEINFISFLEEITYCFRL